MHTAWLARARCLLRFLPEGGQLSRADRNSRQQVILWLLWLHGLGLFALALATGNSLEHSLLESLSLVPWALAGGLRRLPFRARACSASLGLLTASAVLVHLMGGAIEAHFHFFVMIAVIALYQDWLPFLLAIGFVLFEHGLGGLLVPTAVYNHPDALEHQWQWAGIHAAFVLGACAAVVTHWRLSEVEQARLRRAEHVLRESQRVLSTLMSNLPGMAYRCANDSRWTTEFVSEGAFDLTGYTPADLARVSYAELIHPDDREWLWQNTQQAIAERRPFQQEYRIRAADGSERWVFEQGRAVYGADGQVLALEGFISDITERRQAALELARSEERFRALVQNGGELISVVDPDGTLRYASPSAETLLGVAAQEVLGASLFAYVHPDDELAVRRLLATAANSQGTNLTGAFRLRQADGAWHHVEAVCRNLAEVPGVGGIVLNVRDVSERKALEQELAYRAYHDTLTELPNRALLVDRLGHALARGARNRRQTGVLFIDLDDFKIVNDSLGHRLGDQLLLSVAQRLRACVRAGDTVARLGGDEFVVLLEDLVSPTEAADVAERILALVGTAFHLDGREVFVGASIGLALSGSEPALPDDLLRDADIAMYRAKARGKGHWELFEPGMNTRSLERLELEADLRRALERGEFRLHYQPIVQLETGQLCGVEALLRWQHPERGLVPPSQFIPLAEETGLIVPIGRWVLQEACRQARAWHRRAPAALPLVMSVNLSSRQFQHPNLVEDVAEALRTTGLLPSSLKLEITESAAMEAGIGTIQTLQALKGLGVQLAIDDFGTGYSSLSYLKRFPVDTLKIDKSFVDGLGQDEQDSAIVRSVIALARTLGLSVTAEGIETLEQLEDLCGAACDEGQGYYFARPQPGEQVDRLLAEGQLSLPPAGQAA